MPQNVYPYLNYRDAPAAIDWLEQAFGFERGLVVDEPGGIIAHAQLSLDGGVIMLATAREGRKTPVDTAGNHGGLYVAIEDVDAHCERARAAGATITREPNDTEYGSREYGAIDPEGHEWSFGTYRP